MILSITSIGFLRAKILFSSLFFRKISVKGCLTTGVQVDVAPGEAWERRMKCKDLKPFIVNLRVMGIAW